MSKHKKHELEKLIESLEEIEKQISEFKEGIPQFFKTTEKPLVLNLRIYEPRKDIPRVDRKANMLFLKYQIMCLGNIIKKKKEIETKEMHENSLTVIERFLELASTVLERKKKDFAREEKLEEELE